jgi:hypothetical protein
MDEDRGVLAGQQRRTSIPQCGFNLGDCRATHGGVRIAGVPIYELHIFIERVIAVVKCLVAEFVADTPPNGYSAVWAAVVHQYRRAAS